MTAPDQVTRCNPTSSTIEAALDDAFEIFGEIEATLDRQIYPEQAKQDFDAPPEREYSLTLTAKEWGRYSIGMLMLGRAIKLMKEGKNA